MRTRRLLLALAVLASVVTQPLPVSAQDWPSQPVTIVVPYAPGGAVDIMARALAQRLQFYWKQPVVVENKAGAVESIAATGVAHAKPDGYTLFLATEVALETNPFLFSKLAYNPATDFTPITRVVEGPLVYVVRKDSPILSIQQLVQQAKGEPGKISYGSSGNGGSVHLAVNWFSIISGSTPFLHVPYRGAAPAVQDLLAGHVTFSAAPLSLVAPFIKENRLRALAITGESRIRTLADTPTLQELGYKDSVTKFMFGLVGPAKMPPKLAARISSDVGTVIRDPDFQARNVEPNGFVLAAETPESFARFLAADREKQQARVKAANVQLD